MVRAAICSATFLEVHRMNPLSGVGLTTESIHTIEVPRVLRPFASAEVVRCLLSITWGCAAAALHPPSRLDLPRASRRQRNKHDPPPDIGEAFLSIRDVCATLGVSRAWVYERIANGKFPKQYHLSKRRVVWVRSEIQAYMGQVVSRDA
jgi:prophage regulatory protein